MRWSTSLQHPVTIEVMLRERHRVVEARGVALAEAQRAELAAVVAFVAHADRAGGELADEDARVHHAVGALEVEAAGARLLGRAPAAHEAVGRHRHLVARMRGALPALRDEALGERGLVLRELAR